jgi:hypothetical protein
MVDTIERVNAQPVKRFFIDIITRDIDLAAAILDLVDNSVDSARMQNPDGDLSGVTIEVVAEGSEFSIVDNCAGMDVDHAKGYVFRMGRPTDVSGATGSIGQFGVGLKRSLFKLGTNFIVNSRSSHSDFTVELDVDAWEKKPDWDFDIRVHDREPHETTGTTIIVDSLHDSVEEAFAEVEGPEGQEPFSNLLRSELVSRHRIAMGNGMTLTLNGELLTAGRSEVADSELISAAVNEFTITTPDGQPVRVKIVAGAAPQLSGMDEDAQPEEVEFPAAEAGWEVFGNGRLLLSAEKTRITGWGSGKARLPLFHNQYARFRGFVYMEADDSSAIPWNTMKTGVDSGSPVWAEVREAMIVAGREIVTLLNYAKSERQAGKEGDEAPITTALNSAATVVVEQPSPVGVYSISIDEVRADGVVHARYPAPNPNLRSGVKTVAYAVDLDAFQLVSRALNENAAARVGRATFNAFLDDVDK